MFIRTEIFFERCFELLGYTIAQYCLCDTELLMCYVRGRSLKVPKKFDFCGVSMSVDTEM